ncbi:hypothetical protein PROFUN_13666 [Planoprotostelium fungivorum]|uniref:Uncharacterized protein n=1 Tax=Planoprotostelium fungivorum TaxID=1890364 RepID=A0A2P6MN10_9EUKA|nr:hypothetical protein PROFUN_13666 [Planoprotostelium fungivorum]
MTVQVVDQRVLLNCEYLSIPRIGYSNTHDSSHCTCDETASHLREEGASKQEPNNKTKDIASMRVHAVAYTNMHRQCQEIIILRDSWPKLSLCSSLCFVHSWISPASFSSIPSVQRLILSKLLL